MNEDILWEGRNPDETTALKCLVDAEACLGAALLNDSAELFLKALEFSEKVIEFFPQCAIAHYFAGFSCLKCKDDKNYAKQKYDLLCSIKSDDADTLAKRLEEEIDKIKDS